MINCGEQQLNIKYLFTESWMIFRSNLVFLFIGIIVGLFDIMPKSMSYLGSLLFLLKLVFLITVSDLVNKVITKNEIGWYTFIDTLKRCIIKAFLWVVMLLFFREFILRALKIFAESNIVYMKLLGPLLLAIMMVIFITLYGFTPIAMMLKNMRIVDAFAYSNYIAKKHWWKICSIYLISGFILFIILFIIASLVLVIAYFFISAGVYSAGSITHIARDIIPIFVGGILCVYCTCIITLLFIQIDRYEN